MTEKVVYIYDDGDEWLLHENGGVTLIRHPQGDREHKDGVVNMYALNLDNTEQMEAQMSRVSEVWSEL